MGDAAFVYLSPDESSRHAPIPAMTQITGMGTVGRFQESRVNMGGRIQKAFFLNEDIFKGTEERARAIIRERSAAKARQKDEQERARCMAAVRRPAHGETIGGALPGSTWTGYSRPTSLYYDGEPEPLPHEMTFNTRDKDAVVKIKQGEETVVALYLRSNSRLTLDLDDGAYTVYFAQGVDFSPECGKFMAGMRIFKDAEVNRLSSSNGYGASLRYELDKPVFTSLGSTGSTLSSTPVNLDEFADHPGKRN